MLRFKLFYISFVLFFSFSSYSQILISGKVLSENLNQPIDNVNIYIKDNNKVGTISSNTGEFELIVPITCKGNKIVFSHIGFEKAEINIELLKGSTSKEIFLKPINILIDEINVSMTLSSKKILKTAFRKFNRNHFNYGYYTASFNQKNFHYCDTTLELQDVSQIRGVMKQCVNCDTLSNSNQFIITDFFKYGLIDSLCYSSPMHLTSRFNKKMLSFEKSQVIKFLPLWSINPINFSSFAYPNFSGHYSIIANDNVFNEKNVWIIEVKNLSGINYDFLLPEEVFREKFKSQLIEYKGKINYSPSNPLFVLSESQIDSLFYANLRKKFKGGRAQIERMTLHIDKKSFAILKADFKISSFSIPSTKLIGYTNFTLYYKNVYSRFNRVKWVVDRIEIAYSGNKCGLSNYTSIQFSDFKFGSEARILTLNEECYDNTNNTFNELFFPAYKNEWESIIPFSKNVFDIIKEYYPLH